ncbi:MAG TPA: VanZ family protein [Microbacterium sp.]|nr:VanZ family protein [Microbacterium sp.]
MTDSASTRTPAPARRIRPALLLAAYVLALGLIAFSPSPVDRPAAGLLLRFDAWMPGSHGALEFTANVLLFVPLGVLLALQLPRRAAWVAVVAGTAASVAIEMVQAVLLPERVAAPSDVLANTIGAAAGVLLLGLLRRRRSP